MNFISTLGEITEYLSSDNIKFLVNITLKIVDDNDEVIGFVCEETTPVMFIGILDFGINSNVFSGYMNFKNVTELVIKYDTDVLFVSYKDDILSIKVQSNYRISPYIDKKFSDDKMNLVDFKRDLLPNICLNKTVIRQQDGRPLKCEYYYNNELMAEIAFTFETDDNNLIKRRIETLNYIKTDGTKGMDILIKDKIYDINNSSDMTTIVEERVKSREYIINYIQMFTLGVMKQYNPDKTQDEIIQMVLPYWDNCEYNRLKFLEVGLPMWRDSILSIDLDTTDYTFMSYVIDVNGTILRDYLSQLLTY